MPGISARGTTLLISDMTPLAADYNAVGQVVSITGPSLALDTVDVTAHNSTDGWEEHVATILRTGELTLEVNYDPASPMHMATPGAGLPITGVDVAPANEFVVAGDWTALFVAGVHFRIAGSTNNDGSWETVSSTYAVGPNETTIVVAQDVGADADGDIFVTTLPMAMTERLLVDLILLFPDIGATEWDMAAFVTAIEPSAPFDGKLSASVSLKVSGAPTLV